MFSKLRNEISAHKVRYSVISAVLVLAVVLFALFGVSYIRRHFRTVNIDREQAARTEQIDMKGKKGIIIYFTRVGNTDFAKDVDAVSSASLMNDGGKLVGNSELLSKMIANATGYPLSAIKTLQATSTPLSKPPKSFREKNLLNLKTLHRIFPVMTRSFWFIRSGTGRFPFRCRSS